MSGISNTYLTFNDGFKCPVLGLGTWQSEPKKVFQAVLDAIDVGYRHIDGAYLYQNENEIGRAIRQKIKEGKVKREDVFVTSKLWSTFHRSDLVRLACEKSLSDLGLDYLDLYLIHWPMAIKEGDSLFPLDADGVPIPSQASYIDAWKEMEKLVEIGLVKSIGVSNFNKSQLDDVLSVADIKPVTNQVECHPYLNQKLLKKYCESKDIIITAYSPLGSPAHPLSSKNDPVLLNDLKIAKIGEKYGKSPAQILVKYQIQRGNIVVPKSVTKLRIIENANVFDFQLDNVDMNTLDSLESETKKRYCAFPMYGQHKNYPFHSQY